MRERDRRKVHGVCSLHNFSYIIIVLEKKKRNLFPCNNIFNKALLVILSYLINPPEYFQASSRALFVFFRVFTRAFWSHASANSRRSQDNATTGLSFINTPSIKNPLIPIFLKDTFATTINPSCINLGAYGNLSFKARKESERKREKDIGEKRKIFFAVRCIRVDAK